jgi:hypothetical protein
MAASYESLVMHDRMRIRLSESWQIAYWTRVLEVTEDELRSLVREVGDQTHLVRARLTDLREAGKQQQAA